MGHSDEWTFADYFRYEKEIYRAIISAAVLCQWIAEHDTPPTDGEAEELVREIDRRLWIVRLPLCMAAFLYPNTITI